MFEHRTRGHLTDPLTGQPEAGDEPVERRGQHVLVGVPRVPAVGTGERNTVATKHGYAAYCPLLTRKVYPMGDRYSSFARSGLGKPLVKRLGLPIRRSLVAMAAGDPAAGPVLLGPDDGPHFAALSELLKPTEEAERYHALVFDATGLSTPEDLRALYEFFHPVARSLTPSGRVIVIGKAEETAAQQALDGFVRSVGKEFGRGTTAQLVRLKPGRHHRRRTLHIGVPAVGQVGVRERPDHRDRAGHAGCWRPDRQGGAGDRRGPRDRRRDRRRAGARRRTRDLPGRPGRRTGPGEGGQPRQR